MHLRAATRHHLLAAGLVLALASGSLAAHSPGVPQAERPSSPAAALRLVHVFVALADNEHQGIVPVPKRIGNGEDPAHNLYWGAAFGVMTHFRRHPGWTELRATGSLPADVLERVVFRHRSAGVLLVADAYRGAAIKRTVVDFLAAAAGSRTTTIETEGGARAIAGTFVPALVAYVGHDGLMDFGLGAGDLPATVLPGARDAIVLACASKQYFSTPLRATGARPLLLTTGLMAPEAYTLSAALDGWVAGEGGEPIRNRAAAAYDRYQKCGAKAARRLFATGW